MLQYFGVPQEVLLCGGTPGLLSRVDLACVSVAVHRGSFRGGGGYPQTWALAPLLSAPRALTQGSSPLFDGFFPSYSR